MLYAEVIVPLPLQGTFTYTIPDQYAQQLSIGCRVIVQFGKKKYYTGIIQNIYEGEEEKDDIKEIISVLDESPIINPVQLDFWQWIASYYMCTIGEVYKAALPSALKLESETLVFLNPDYEALSHFTTNESRIFDILSENKPLRISEIEKALSINNATPYIKTLAERKAILINENIQNRYSAKTETGVRLTQSYQEDELSEIIDNLKRAKKQQKLLIDYLSLLEEAASPSIIKKKTLLEYSRLSSGILDSLIERGILETFPIEISRFNFGEANMASAKSLNPFQAEAYDSIKEQFRDKEIVLLHGVTSSGKTEIYIRLIQEQLLAGKHALYLLPEIALTTQITERLKVVFGDKLLVYHSKFNENERAETWQALLNSDEAKIVLGARSAIFLPFEQLGLIIVDEEHESSYKQQDPAPRYNAKNAAIVLASKLKAKTILGSATPSIETFYNAINTKYGLVGLIKRYDEIEPPIIRIVNTKDLRRRKLMKSILSPPLTHDINQVLSRGEQVILFQNRRGFAPMLECKTCSWTPKCEHCDVSLTYHKNPNALVCHYCGAVYSTPQQCPDCETPTLEIIGYGTERIEETVNEEIPEAITLRMDMDTTRNKRAYGRIIQEFEDNKANILIGTQMVSKGLDFDNVSLVGILNADSMLNYPDFRAHEKAFQLMVQVSGRAGRKNKQGTVVLQTAHPNHPIISFVKNNDYNSFYETQIQERKLFRYPPFFRLIEIVIRHKDISVADSMANEFAILLRQSFQDRILGPTKPPVSRIQALHIRKIIIKIENQASPNKIRETIESYKNYMLANPKYKSILVHYDVDPL